MLQLAFTCRDPEAQTHTFRICIVLGDILDALKVLADIVFIFSVILLSFLSQTVYVQLIQDN